MDLNESHGNESVTPSTVIENRLNLSLRLAASQASSLVGGGASLLFTVNSADASAPPQLRAAAGFRTPEEARSAANRATSLAQDAIMTGEPQTTSETGSPEHASATLALPLAVPKQVLGVLVIGYSGELTTERRNALESVAWSTAAQLDYPSLNAKFEKLAHDSENHVSAVDEKSDELLKLSEELFAQDIELLQNNEKLGKIEKLKNDFIEKMSRELRTPLNNIIEATITVLASENDTLSASSQQALRRALDEGTAFQRTLQNILDLWRIKQNEFPIETQEFSFAEIIDETIFSIGDTLGDKTIEIIKEIPKPLPKIRGDLAKINQILFLILDNSAKFIEDGTISIGAHYEDGRLHCSIHDTGIGICADDQEFIWNEFYQVDDRASNKYRGAGLGLTLVQDLLILLEGESTLRSEPGKGTRVEFSIPVTLA